MHAPIVSTAVPATKVRRWPTVGAVPKEAVVRMCVVVLIAVTATGVRGHAYAPFATNDFTSVIPVHTVIVMEVVDPGASKKRMGAITVERPKAGTVHTAFAALVTAVTSMGA